MILHLYLKYCRLSSLCLLMLPHLRSRRRYLIRFCFLSYSASCQILSHHLYDTTLCQTKPRIPRLCSTVRQLSHQCVYANISTGKAQQLTLYGKISSINLQESIWIIARKHNSSRAIFLVYI